MWFKIGCQDSHGNWSSHLREDQDRVVWSEEGCPGGSWRGSDWLWPVQKREPVLESSHHEQLDCISEEISETRNKENKCSKSITSWGRSISHPVCPWGCPRLPSVCAANATDAPRFSMPSGLVPGQQPQWEQLLRYLQTPCIRAFFPRRSGWWTFSGRHPRGSVPHRFQEEPSGPLCWPWPGPGRVCGDRASNSLDPWPPWWAEPVLPRTPVQRPTLDLGMKDK